MSLAAARIANLLRRAGVETRGRHRRPTGFAPARLSVASPPAFAITDFAITDSLSHAAMAFQHCVVAFLSFGRRDVADGLQEPPVVEPVHPFQHGDGKGGQRQKNAAYYLCHDVVGT